MKINLLYGKRGLELDLTGIQATILKPQFVEGLPDEAFAFKEAVRNPIESRPLREVVSSGDRVAVVIPDITRALPSDRLLAFLFEELEHVPKERFTIVIGTGSHRACTAEEIASMVGPIAQDYRLVNHNAHDQSTLVRVGESPFGYPVFFNREYVEADKRIILGFIEPHLMAGYSGGYKAVFPGVADIDAIMHYHGTANIGDPRSTWGNMSQNPTQESIRAAGSLLPVDFCINVTLNKDLQVTQFFCGETLAAHEKGCAFAKRTAMVACDEPFPIVVTTNSGYPLDQNLYQSVKGMSAAAQISGQGGLILTAAECADGFPEHGNFKRFLFEQNSPEAMLDAIHAPAFKMFDQWQIQILAQILLRTRIGLLSEIDDPDVRRAHLRPVRDLRGALEDELKAVGSDAPVAVLPEGPQTIPYLSGS